MAQVIVRNLEEGVKRKLKQRAARHGRSMEEELREILRDAVKDVTRPRGGFGTEAPSCSEALGLPSPFRNCAGIR